MEQQTQTFQLEWILPQGVTPDDFYVLLTAIVAFLVVVSVGASFIQRDTFSGRVKAIQERRAQLKGDLLEAKKRRRKGGVGEHINWMRSLVTKLQMLQQNQATKISESLITAGYRSKDALIIFTFFQLICPFLFLGLAFLLVKIDFSDPLGGPKWKLFAPILMAYFGLKLPNIIVSNARQKRLDQLQKALSDTLDLLLICAEAGLSLAAALDRVSKELGLVYPLMAEELGLASVELGFLPDRKKALTNLADRTGLQEIRGIVNVLIQTEKYGTPIAQALRVLSAEFRTQRMLRAEQKAARLPAIMTIPMIVFILPTMFIIVMTPAGIRLADTLFK